MSHEPRPVPPQRFFCSIHGEQQGVGLTVQVNHADGIRPNLFRNYCPDCFVVHLDQFVQQLRPVAEKVSPTYGAH